MKKYNLIAVFNMTADKWLMCKRKKPPYKGLTNLVGGKVEPGESGIDAAYRELEEETTITKEDIRLLHLMDFTYYTENCCIEVYVGTLNKNVEVRGVENKLFWSELNNDFSDESEYAGNGNISHIMRVIQEKNYQRREPS